MPDPLTQKSIDMGAKLVYAFDELSGSLIDQVGSNDGTVTGSPSYSATDQRGVASNAITWATGQYATLTNPLIGASAYTVHAVVMYTATPFASNHIFDARDAGGDGFRLEMISTGPAFRVTHNSDQATFGSPLTLSQWYHVTISWDGSNCNFYLDGNLEGSPAVTSALSLSGNAVVAGRSFSTATNHWTGGISHIAVWDSAMIGAQVSELFWSGHALGDSRKRNRLRDRHRNR